MSSMPVPSSDAELVGLSGAQIVHQMVRDRGSSPAAQLTLLDPARRSLHAIAIVVRLIQYCVVLFEPLGLRRWREMHKTKHESL